MPVQILESDTDFDTLINRNGVGVVDAYGSWCKPCSSIAPRIEKLSEQYTNVTFGKFDVDGEHDLAEKWNITAMPTFLFFKDGKLAGRIRGADYNGIVKKVEELNA
jgi:thioredoxin 1